MKETQTDTGSQKAQRIGNPLFKRLFTIKEAAVYLGRSVWSIRDLIWSGIIPVVKVSGGRKIYLDIVDLEEFINKNKEIYH